MSLGRIRTVVSLVKSLLVVLGVVGVDRASKLWILASLDRGDAIHVVPGLVAIVHVQNPGAAFGLLATAASPWREVVLVTVSLAAIAAFLWMLWRMPRDAVWERGSASAVIAGAAGNLYDRIAYGAVVDFVDVYVGSWHWPAFNVADSAITLGIAILILASFRRETRTEQHIRRTV